MDWFECSDGQIFGKYNRQNNTFVELRLTNMQVVVVKHDFTRFKRKEIKRIPLTSKQFSVLKSKMGV